MVRLETVLYEKIVNRMTRAKAIGAPRKWYHANPYDHLRLNHHNAKKHTLWGRILAPLADFFTRFQLNFQFDIFRQQGLTPQDRLLHLDRHLRRNVFWQHVARQTLHPYHWVLKVRRRERWGRMDMGMPGFFVPEYIKNQSQTQTYVDYLKLQNQWAHHLHHNYYSDMTPTARRTVVPKWIVLQWIQNFGVLRNQAWDRYFLNEQDNKWHSKQATSRVHDRKTFPFNLTTAQGKRDFQEYVNDYNQKVPGSFSPPGTKFDFKTYYAEIGV